jgi:hypothetical protein
MMRLSAGILALAMALGCTSKEGKPEPKHEPVKVVPAIGALELDVDVADPAAAVGIISARLGGLVAGKLLPNGTPKVVVKDGKVRVKLAVPGGADCSQLAAWSSVIRRAVTRTGRLGFHRSLARADLDTREAVLKSLRALPGVRSAHVDDHNGSLMVDTAAPLSPQQLASITVPEPLMLAAQTGTGKKVALHLIHKSPALNGGDLTDVQLTTDEQLGRLQISVTFSDSAKKRFGDLTASIVEELLAIVVEGAIESAPMVQEAIRGGRAVISMGSDAESPDEASELAAILRGGALSEGARISKEAFQCNQ